MTGANDARTTSERDFELVELLRAHEALVNLERALEVRKAPKEQERVVREQERAALVAIVVRASLAMVVLVMSLRTWLARRRALETVMPRPRVHPFTNERLHRVVLAGIQACIAVAVVD